MGFCTPLRPGQIFLEKAFSRGGARRTRALLSVRESLCYKTREMAYGYKRKRKFSRRIRRTTRPRRFGRSRFGARRFTGVSRGRRPSTNNRAAVARILSLGKRARADDSLIQAAVKHARTLFAGGLGSPAGLADHISRYSNPWGLSASEVTHIVNHPSFPHLASAASDLYRGNYAGAARNAYRFWTTGDDAPSPYSTSTDIVPS